MEQAFQRILAEIYHIVSKKALAQEGDGPAAVRAPLACWGRGPLAACRVGMAVGARAVKQRCGCGLWLQPPLHARQPTCSSMAPPRTTTAGACQRHRHQGHRGGARGQEEEQLLPVRLGAPARGSASWMPARGGRTAAAAAQAPARLGRLPCSGAAWGRPAALPQKPAALTT